MKNATLREQSLKSLDKVQGLSSANMPDNVDWRTKSKSFHNSRVLLLSNEKYIAEVFTGSMILNNWGLGCITPSGF